VDGLGVAPALWIPVPREEAKPALAKNPPAPFLPPPADKDARREIETDRRDVGGLECDRCGDGLRRECEHRLDGHVRRLDERDAGRGGRTNGGATAEIGPGTGDGGEGRRGRIEGARTG